MLSHILLAVYALLIVAALLNVLTDNREPDKTIAWLLVLLGLPVAGFILYLFFGKNLKQEYRSRKRNAKRISRQVFSRFIRKDIDHYPPRYESLMLSQKKACYALPYLARDIRLIQRGADYFQTLEDDIDQARHHVHIESFIFENDQAGQRIAQALARAAQRGVEVRLIYDDVGCWTVPRRFFRAMRQRGIQAEPFERVRFRMLTHRVNYRNHRKIAVIDGRIAYAGGMNIADRYADPAWRDQQVRLQGSAVYGLQQIFLSDWFLCTSQDLADSPYYPDLPAAGQPEALAQIVSTEPFGTCHNLLMAYTHLIENARQRILIQTPYFMPTETIRDAIRNAALRGVKVQIMVPAKPGGRWMTRANESYFQSVLEMGAEILAYNPGMLHAKTLVIDDDFAAVGSVNIDYRSLLDTFEDSAFFYDADVNARLAALFAADKPQCTLVDLDTWKRRSTLRKLSESFIRIFTPLM